MQRITGCLLLQPHHLISRFKDESKSKIRSGFSRSKHSWSVEENTKHFSHSISHPLSHLSICVSTFSTDPLSLTSLLPSALAQDLLSRDPTRFNSCINHNFESQSTYKGHGVELKGVSNIKHAATLFNTLDGGKAAVVKRENIAWDPE